MGGLSLDVDVLLVSKTLAGNPVNLRDQSPDKGFLVINIILIIIPCTLLVH